MKDTFEFTLNNPLTEEQWDMITDVDFDRTDRITFHTKHGKEVEFTKVIRCRECRYRDDVGRCELNDLHWVNGEDFCSWAESIIRCKNCKWFVNSKCTIHSLTSADDNSYCIYAEPKENNE